MAGNSTLPFASAALTNSAILTLACRGAADLALARHWLITGRRPCIRRELTITGTTRPAYNAGMRDRQLTLSANTGTLSVVAVAFGAAAVGALAIGALSIGALAIATMNVKRLKILEAKLADLHIDRLTIGRLEIENATTPQSATDSAATSSPSV